MRHLSSTDYSPPPPPPPPPPPSLFLQHLVFTDFRGLGEKGAFSHPHPLPPPSGLSSSHTLCFTCAQGKDWRMKLTQRIASWKSVALMKRRRRSPWTSDFSVPVPPPPPPQPLDMAQHKLQASALHATVTRRGTTACDRKGEKVVSALCITATVATRTRIAPAVLVRLKLRVWNQWGLLHTKKKKRETWLKEWCMLVCYKREEENGAWCEIKYLPNNVLVHTYSIC